MQMRANAGGDAYETPQCGYIKGATKAKSECECFPLTITVTLHKRIKGAPAFCIGIMWCIPPPTPPPVGV